MQSSKSRIHAVLGLFGFAVLYLTSQTLPWALTRLQQHKQWIKGVRARINGASFVGEAGIVLQSRGNDCGAACLKMVLSAHGIECSLTDLALELETTSKGTTLLNLRVVATRRGLPARSWAIRDSDLRKAPLPAIAFIHGNHFVVVRRFATADVLEIDDPALGRVQWPVRSFLKAWPGETLIFDPAWVPL